MLEVPVLAVDVSKMINRAVAESKARRAAAAEAPELAPTGSGSAQAADLARVPGVASAPLLALPATPTLESRRKSRRGSVEQASADVGIQQRQPSRRKPLRAEEAEEEEPAPRMMSRMVSKSLTKQALIQLHASGSAAAAADLLSLRQQRATGELQPSAARRVAAAQWASTREAAPAATIAEEAQEATETLTASALALAFMYVAHVAPPEELAARQRATAMQLHGRRALGRWTLDQLVEAFRIMLGARRSCPPRYGLRRIMHAVVLGSCASRGRGAARHGPTPV